MDGIDVVADAKLALQELEKELDTRGYKTSEDYRNKIKSLKNEWDNEVDRLYALKPQSGANILPQTAVLGKVNDAIGDDGIVVCAAGSLPGDLTRLWRTTKRKKFHLEYAYSCMGYEIAGAMGVKMAEPNSEVFVVIGDGSYLMLHTEILTSIMEKRKIIIVMFDSVGFNCIESLSKSQGASGYGNRLCIRDDQSNKLTGKPVQIDFAANAKSYGAVSYKANSLEELEECLKKAKKETKTVLIETKVGIGTMSPGYESWWRVGVAGVSKIPSVNDAYKKMQEMLKKTRDY
jgi:3D-(3,5/4)-trihydroxycyclohexane-1,2-dione acylhydrolase (decyclizing)